MATQFEVGFLVGLLVGEGHFGGDGRQPHVTLRMHVRHEALFRWLERAFPGGRLYGPYHHGGREYLQWMARGPFLRDELAPLLDQWLTPGLDRHSFGRYQLMKSRYPQLTAPPADGETAATAPPPTRDPAADGDPAPPAGDHDRAGARSASPVTAAPEPSAAPRAAASPFADLFAELRQAWPS